MTVLENILYVCFFITLLRWCLAFYQIATHPLGGLATIKTSFTDNILWIAPVIYFSGGLG